MRRVFVDTSHLIGVFNEDDSLHARAMEIAEQLLDDGVTSFVITLMVLEEFLTDVSKREAGIKAMAAAFVETILSDPIFEVVNVDGDLFRLALDQYKRRRDKAYSMVDCVSMEVCRLRGITEVLTGDKDFEQERLIALLRS